MNDLLTIHFKTRTGFRDWLMQHHDKSAGIWMVYYKKHTKKKNIPYGEALEEALCFGWIDSLVKRRDEDTYVRKFTPRVNTLNWSEKNRWKALKLIREGKMTEAGLNKLWDPSAGETELRNKDISNEPGTGVGTGSHLPDTGPGEKNRKNRIRPNEMVFPDYILEAFRQHEPALTHFKSLAPSHQRNYLQWITSAKREETIRKRLDESIQLLKRNQKLGLK